MSNLTKYFKKTFTSTSVYAFQDVNITDDYPRKLKIDNLNEDIAVLIKFMDPTEGEGIGIEGIYLDGGGSIIIESEGPELPYKKVGAKLDSAGSVQLVISAFEYERYE